MKKVMLITGTSKGIGRFLAEEYVKNDFLVVGCSRSEPEHKLQNERYLHFQIDVTNESEVKKLISQIDKKFKRLDILINNVGAASMNHFLLTPGHIAGKLFNANFLASFLVAREASKIMMKNKFGRIVNFSSVAVPLNLEGEAVYASVKSAVETLTCILAKELSPFGITCNAIGPSPIMTDLIRNIPRDKINMIVEALAVKRLGEFRDVANVVNFLIAEESDYVTGQTIYLGGVR